ncbi:CRISPR-associated endonuclease Cas2, partial [Acinetobacter baumannii]
MSLFVIGYDIAEPKRLQRVHRVMQRHATAIEYSIFLLNGTELAAKKCMQDILRIIKLNEDD